MTADLRAAAQKALVALEYHTQQTRPIVQTEHAIKALMEALAAQSPAEAHGGVDCIGLALDLEARAKTVESQNTERAMKAAAHGLRLLAAKPQPKGTAQKLEDIEQYRMQMAGISTAALGYWKEGDDIHPDYDTVPLRDVAKLYAKYDALYKAAQAPAPAPELSDEDILRIWRKHYPTSVPGQLTIMAARDVIAADRTRQAPAVGDGQ